MLKKKRFVSKKHMDRIIKADLYRYGGLTGIKGFFRGLTDPGFRYMYLLRKGSKCYKYSIKGLFYRILIRRYKYKYGFQIPVTTQIGEGFYIGHFGTIVINHDVKIGSNCNITHGVTIGQANRGKLKGCPALGDKVWIGAGSVIVGKINIGSNVLIAPNSYVNFDIPDNSLVLGNPAKIVERDNPTEGYINYILE
jgi:serine O-acetyltransferase